MKLKVGDRVWFNCNPWMKEPHDQCGFGTIVEIYNDNRDYEVLKDGDDPENIWFVEPDCGELLVLAEIFDTPLMRALAEDNLGNADSESDDS